MAHLINTCFTRWNPLRKFSWVICARDDSSIIAHIIWKLAIQSHFKHKNLVTYVKWNYIDIIASPRYIYKISKTIMFSLRLALFYFPMLIQIKTCKSNSTVFNTVWETWLLLIQNVLKIIWTWTQTIQPYSESSWDESDLWNAATTPHTPSSFSLCCCSIVLDHELPAQPVVSQTRTGCFPNSISFTV